MIVSNALKTALYQLFVPSGRTNRQTFWIWLAVFAVLVVSFDWGLKQHPPGGTFRFWGYLIATTMLFSGLFGVFGKRLKDFNKSVGWIILILVASCAIMLVFGILNGAGDYVSEFSQYDRKEEIDEEIKRQLREEYEQTLSSSPIWLMNGSLLAVWIGFTLWVGLSPGDKDGNRYGPAPK